MPIFTLTRLAGVSRIARAVKSYTEIGTRDCSRTEAFRKLEIVTRKKHRPIFSRRSEPVPVHQDAARSGVEPVAWLVRNYD